MLHRSSSSSTSRGTNTCDTTYAASVAVVAAQAASADRTTTIAAATYEATYRAISCHTTVYGASSSSTSPSQVVSAVHQCAL